MQSLFIFATANGRTRKNSLKTSCENESSQKLQGVGLSNNNIILGLSLTFIFLLTKIENVY